MSGSNEMDLATQALADLGFLRQAVVKHIESMKALATNLGKEYGFAATLEASSHCTELEIALSVIDRRYGSLLK